MSADDQKLELLRVNQSLSLNKNDNLQRMKLAVILALPSSRLRDTMKAQALLDDLLKEKNLSSEQKLLALLLNDINAESIRLSAKAKDDQKRADALQKKADDLQQKSDELQQKLNDLKNIERTMQSRDSGTKK